MKSAIIGVKYNDETHSSYDKIKTELENSGNTVDFSYFDSPLEKDYEDLENAYKRNQKLIKECDFLVAEITQFSSGIGFLIASALNEKKPVLTLFNAEKGKVISSVLKASAESNKLLAYQEYKTDEELNSVLKSFTNDVKQKLDTKFILIIPAEIDRYLEWAADFRRMHKSQIVRKAIEAQIELDEEWKNKTEN